MAAGLSLPGGLSWPLRRILRLVWWVLCALTFIALPLTVWEFSRVGYDIHYQAWFIGGIFVILSFPISVYEVALHTEHYTQPRLQRYIIRILWMVPIYGVDAWLALRFRDAREYLDPLRECYEAFVIYSFYAYLMAYLEDTVGNLEEHMSRKPPMQHLAVIRWFAPPWQMGQQFMMECKKGILTYVIVRPVCTAIGFVTDMFNEYGSGQINFHKSYVYLMFATNFSQCWALYCLMIMYMVMHEELAPIRPLSKFLVVKAVVFVTFWQGLLLAVLVYTGVVTPDSWTTYDRQNLASGVQDFLICIEMFAAALGFAYAFPPRDYMDASEGGRGFFHNVKHMFDLRDVAQDMREVVDHHRAEMVNTALETTSKIISAPGRAVAAAVKAPARVIQMLNLSGVSARSKKAAEDVERAALLSANHGAAATPAEASAAAAGGAGVHHRALEVAGMAGSDSSSAVRLVRGAGSRAASDGLYESDDAVSPGRRPASRSSMSGLWQWDASEDGKTVRPTAGRRP